MPQVVAQCLPQQMTYHPEPAPNGQPICSPHAHAGCKGLYAELLVALNVWQVFCDGNDDSKQGDEASDEAAQQARE